MKFQITIDRVARLALRSGWRSPTRNSQVDQRPRRRRKKLRVLRPTLVAATRDFELRVGVVLRVFNLLPRIRNKSNVHRHGHA